MSPTYCGRFLRQLLAILRPEARSFLLSCLRAKPTPDELISELIHRGHLTTFQAGRLRSGQRNSLLVADRYTLLEQVGRGGMGTVYRGWDRKLRRPVAVKFLQPRNPVTPALLRQYQKRFAREARLLACLPPHPQVVTLFDAGSAVGQRFLILEWVPGITLFRLVQDSGPVPWPEARRIVRDLCLGLEHLNQHGIVHRDVKPGNAIRTPEGTVKLLDLGIALPTRDEEHSPDTELWTPSGLALGTPGYMAPEAFGDSHRLDSRADVFAAAVVLYYLGTGRSPFAADDPGEVLGKNARAELPSLAPIPLPVRSILLRALARRPTDRYPCPAALAAALDQAGDASTTDPRLSRRRAGIGKFTLLLVLFLLLLLGVSLRLFWCLP
jgi:serine/threonine-protein kinase